MDKADLDHLRKIVKKDPKYVRFHTAVQKNPNLQLPFEDLHEEIDRLHKTRSIRSLNRKDKRFTASVLDAMLDDSRARSRLVEILGSCLAITNDFQETLTNLRDYLLLEYSGRIGKGRTTKEERRKFMENVLRSFYRYVQRVEHLKAHAELVVQDIDKASYTFTNMTKAIELLGRPEKI